LAVELAPARDRDVVKALLRGGLGLSVGLMATGLVLRLASGATAAPGASLAQLFAGEVPWGDRLMGLGAVTLGLTPALRVLTLVALWTRERDWRFVAVAVLVVLTLGVSLALGVG
jgi:uncharacterized membrane protein